MIALYQFTHSLTAFLPSTTGIAGLVVRVRLYSSGGAFTDLTIKPSSMNIIIRNGGVNGYINIKIPTSTLDASAITDRIDGRIEIKLINTLFDGSEQTIHVYDVSISDFRFDIGTSSATYTIVLRDDFATPTKSAITQDKYISKRKLAYVGAAAVYVYSVNGVDFRKYSIGAAMTDGIDSGLITQITLNMANKSLELLIEVTE